MIIANATGCSSIYGGSAPAIPYCTNAKGHGPAWANSLFEDNAEFGYGMFLGVFQQRRGSWPRPVRKALEAADVPAAVKTPLQGWLENMQDAGRLAHLRRPVEGAPAASTPGSPLLAEIHRAAKLFTKKSVWIFGGDGWAYDIGYGGARPRHGGRRGRQRPRARHRGLLQHRRPVVQVHADRVGGQVRGLGQEDAQEGPGPDDDDLRLRLRRQRGDGRQQEPDDEGDHRGRDLPGALA